jgi:hypothetical protein
MRIVIADMTPTGTETARVLLDDVPNPVTLRELVRHRVREEVVRYNTGPGVRFNGLVQPTDAECTANGYKLRRPRQLDWQAQAAAALDSFQRNGFFVFVGNRQVADLDEELTLAETEEVSFVRLVPLVGG